MELPAPQSRATITAIVLTVFSVVFIVLGRASYAHKSATWDEPVHLTAGFAGLSKHDFRIDAEHPPLLRLWAAMPLVLVQHPTINTDPINEIPAKAFAEEGLFFFSTGFMYWTNNADQMLSAARFMSLLVGVGLGWLVFFWTREWIGFPAAVIALTFYLIEPNIAANSSLVTTDIGATFFLFATAYALWRTCRQPVAKNIAVLALTFSLALISKYSTVILVAAIPVLLVIAVYYLRTITARRAFGILAILGFCGWATIWAGYGFRYEPSNTADWLFSFHTQEKVATALPTLSSIIGWIDAAHLLPNAYTEGFLYGQYKGQFREGFLNGQISITGWWYYFPIAFLLKTPISLILLAITSVFLWIRNRSVWRVGDLAFLIIPPGILLAAAMASHLNIGLRHILPIYPFVIMLGAAAAWELVRRWHRIGGAVVGVATAFWLFEVAMAYPSTLTFFNQFVGGPKNGAKYLLDSNLDWGQDLKGLGEWMRDHDVPTISLSYFGSADPAYYGIHYTPLIGSPFFVSTDSLRPPVVPGYVAVSATNLAGLYDRQLAEAFAPLHAREPAAVIGNTIKVYWVDRPWW